METKELLIQMVSDILQDNKKQYHEADFEQVNELIRQQGLYGMFAYYTEQLPTEMQNRTNKELQRNSLHLYKSLYYTRYLIDQLRISGVEVVLIKGCNLAGLYRVPEYRSFGDIDLLLCDGSQVDLANQILVSLGCKVNDRQDSRHHIEYRFTDGMIIELHSFAVRAFESDKTNEIINEIFRLNQDDVEYYNIYGYTFPVLKDGKNACYLLLHMLQHFLNAGFGVRLLIDWYVFWNRDIYIQEVEKYLQYIKKLKMEGFSKAITYTCVRYLGLDGDEVNRLLPEQSRKNDQLTKDLMEDLLAAGRYGEQNSSRVVAPSNASIFGLFLEFHHQMKENYGKASRVYLIWPFLWISTLIRFLYNNKKIRNSNLKSVLKSSIIRGKLVDKIMRM